MSATNNQESCCVSKTNNTNGVPGKDTGVSKLQLENKSGKMTMRSCGELIIRGFGIVLITVGVIMTILWPYLFKTILKSQMSLTDGSATFDMWVETPLPMYSDIYFFNWTNPEDTLKHGSKPKLQEVGPYVFSEHHSKDKIQWNDDGTVTYQQYRKWMFRQDLSNGSLSDMITSANVIAVTIGHQCMKLGATERRILSEVIKFEEENLYVRKNVSELLFDGYNDPLLNILNTLKKKIHIPISIDMDKFGWFYKRNMSDTADGIFTMETGEYDFDKLGDVVQWNGKTRVPYFPGRCGKIEGSLGELWPPSRADDETVLLYAPEICSNLLLSKGEKVTLENLTGFDYTSTAATFDNGTVYPEMACFCSGNNCPMSGVRDLSGCFNGAPVFISHPHFYLADPTYLEMVEGLHPDPEKHRFHLSLEENTAVPLDVEANLQINLRLQPISYMPFYEKLPNIYMPMIWFRQHAEVTPRIAASIHPIVVVSSYGIWIFVGISLLGILISLISLELTSYRVYKKHICCAVCHNSEETNEEEGLCNN